MTTNNRRPSFKSALPKPPPSYHVNHMFNDLVGAISRRTGIDRIAARSIVRWHLSQSSKTRTRGPLARKDYAYGLPAAKLVGPASVLANKVANGTGTTSGNVWPENMDNADKWADVVLAGDVFDGGNLYTSDEWDKLCE